MRFGSARSHIGDDLLDGLEISREHELVLELVRRNSYITFLQHPAKQMNPIPSQLHLLCFLDLLNCFGVGLSYREIHIARRSFCLFKTGDL